MCVHTNQVFFADAMSGQAIGMHNVSSYFIQFFQNSPKSMLSMPLKNSEIQTYGSRYVLYFPNKLLARPNLNLLHCLDWNKFVHLGLASSHLNSVSLLVILMQLTKSR